VGPAGHGTRRDRLGLDERQAAEFMADLWREYLGTPNTELIEYARRLRPRYRTGILSNSFVGAREREQQAYGFEDLVDEIVYSHESGMSKPDPRIYALACARLEVRPAEAVFLDDHDPCVTAAREAGLHAIRYQDNTQAIADIEKLLRSGGTVEAELSYDGTQATGPQLHLVDRPADRRGGRARGLR
jgi:epoxide hydrolase-like predicted phosphatase